jgi:hypothetical protein
MESGMSGGHSNRRAAGVQDPNEARDEQRGTYDPVNEAGKPVRDDKVREHTTPHQRAQFGADVRGDPNVDPATDDLMPDGLRRERRGPVGPKTGVDPKKQR